MDSRDESQAIYLIVEINEILLVPRVRYFRYFTLEPYLVRVGYVNLNDVAESLHQIRALLFDFEKFKLFLFVLDYVALFGGTVVTDILMVEVVLLILWLVN